MPRPQNTVRGTISTNGQSTDLTPSQLRTLIQSDGYVLGGEGGISDGDKGDITVSGGGATWNIDSATITATEIASNAVGSEEIAGGAVTFAKMQNISAARVVGSIAGGNAAELTASNVLDLIGSTRGTVLYRGAVAWTALAVGADGQVLTTHGAGADPTWETASSSSGGTTTMQHITAKAML